jgi:hypothetical protein
VRPNLPHPLADIVSRALSKNPAGRFQSVQELLAELHRIPLASAADLAQLVHATDLRPGESPADGVPRPSTSFNDPPETTPHTLPGTSAVGIEDDDTISTLPYVRSFEAAWTELRESARQGDKDRFVALAEAIVEGSLRETIGYRVEYPIPYFKGTVGYMVDAPMLWIRHSRFPILFVAFNPAEGSILPTVIKQLEIGRATEFFAVLIVVPTVAQSSGDEAQKLRDQVSGSVFQHDFVVLDGSHLGMIIEDGGTHRLIELILRQGVGLYSLSPYVVNGPVPERMFFGREHEVKVISQNIVDRNYTVLGGRRIGKSSILLRLTRLFNSDPRFRAIYINCEDKLNHSEFLEALADDVGVAVNASDCRSIRSIVSAMATDGTSRRVIFVLDEIDELLAHTSHEVEGQRLWKTFRSLSHEGMCRFVFSGSRTVFFCLRDPRSPFFNFCESIILRPLDDKSVAEIVTRPMRQLGIEIQDEERFIESFIELTSSHPNLAQWMCDRLVRTALETLGAGVPALLGQLTEALRSNRRTTVGDLEGLADTREYQDYYVSTALGDAQPLERLISLVAPETGFTRRAIHETVAQYGISDGKAVAEAIDVLDLYSLLVRRGDEYEFRLKRFPRLVRELDTTTSQLNGVLRDLERQQW